MKQVSVATLLLFLLGCGSIMPNSAENQRELTALAANGDYAGVLKRLDQGTSPNAVNELGDSALMRASARQRGMIVELLLERGADPNFMGNQDRTALHFAASAADLEIVHLLIQAGAKVDKKDSTGGTPFSEAILTGHVPTIEAIYAAGIDLNNVLANGDTPLIVTLQNGHEEAVRWLVEAGADPLVSSSKGLTAKSAADSLKRADWLTPAIHKSPKATGSKARQTKNTFREPPPFSEQQVRSALRTKFAADTAQDDDLNELANRLANDLISNTYQPLRSADGRPNPTRKEPSQYVWYYEETYRGSLYKSRTAAMVDGNITHQTEWFSVANIADTIFNRWQKSRAQFKEPPEAWGLAVRFNDRGQVFAVWTNAILPDAGSATIGDTQSLSKILAGAVNNLRRQHGLIPFEMETSLVGMAEDHSRDMVQRGFFSSVTPDGLDVRERAKQHGVPVDIQIDDCILRLSMAEVLLDIAGPEENEQSWAQQIIEKQLIDENQSKHLLNPVYTKIGIGLAVNRSNRLFVTQSFFFQPDLRTSFADVAKKFPHNLDLPLLEKQIHAEVNQARSRRGLRILTFKDSLVRLARSHSQDMANKQYFDHRNPFGELASDRAARMKIRRKEDGVAENLYKERILSTLAIGFDAEGNTSYIPTYRPQKEIAKRIVEGWLNSPGHRANVLETRINSQGIGLAINSQLELYVTQNMY